MNIACLSFLFTIVMSAHAGLSGPTVLLPLPQDTILTQYYDTEEIEQLDAIVAFFDKHVLQACQGSDSLAVCYQQLFDRLLNSDTLDVGVPFGEQNEFQLSNLDRSLFHSIWTYSASRAHEPNGDSQYYNDINYNRGGQYWRFLREVSGAEPYFRKYVEPVEAAGDLPPSLYTGFAYNPSGLDFNDERHRLILAVHFLTVNNRIATYPR